VRQSFSHGRTKAVVVEKVKRRAVTVGEAHPPRETAAPETPAPRLRPLPRRRVRRPKRRARKPLRRARLWRHLAFLDGGRAGSRSRALSGAHEREVEERKRAEIEAKAREEREAREREERAAAEARKREEEARRAQEAESKRRSEQEAKRRLAGGEPSPAPVSTVARKAPSFAATPGVAAAVGATAAARPRPWRTRKLNAFFAVPACRPKSSFRVRSRAPSKRAEALDGRQCNRRRGGADPLRRRLPPPRPAPQGHVNETKEKLAREVILPETITIQELANRMSERGVDVIKLLMKQGQMAKITDVIDADTAQLIARNSAIR